MKRPWPWKLLESSSRIWLARLSPARQEVRALRARLTSFLGRAWGSIAAHYRGQTPARIMEDVEREVLRSPSRGPAVYALVVLALFSFAIWDRFLIPLAVTPYFKPRPRFEVVGFFENGAGGNFVDSLPALARTAGLYDSISPFWHSVNARGQVVGDGYREEVARLARSRGLSIVPLVSNSKADPDHSAAVVRHPAARRAAVENLVALVDARGYDGLAIGFELLPVDAQNGLSLFVEELARALHGRGKTLFVSVFPDVELPQHVSGFFDYESLGAAADRIVMMAYDRHWPATAPGPISPTPWVEASLDSLLRYVPASKVLLGIGTHAYDWPIEERAGLPEYLPTAAALQRAAASSAAASYDEDSRQTSYTYRDGGGRRRVMWVEDAAHIEDKVALARRRRLRGVGVWRLGFSEPAGEAALAVALGRAPR